MYLRIFLKFSNEIGVSKNDILLTTKAVKIMFASKCVLNVSFCKRSIGNLSTGLYDVNIFYFFVNFIQKKQLHDMIKQIKN